MCETLHECHFSKVHLISVRVRAQDTSTAARLRHMGLGLLTAQAGLTALSAVLCISGLRDLTRPRGAVLAATPIHWQRFLMHAGSRTELFEEFRTPQLASDTAVPAASAAEGAARLLRCRNSASAAFCAESRSGLERHHVTIIRLQSVQLALLCFLAGVAAHRYVSSASILKAVLASAAAVLGSEPSADASLMEASAPGGPSCCY